MTIRQQIDGLVREMVAKGILYEDASREFEARFISVALEEEGGSIGRAAERIGMHRNTLSRKIDEYKNQEAVAAGAAAHGPSTRPNRSSISGRRWRTGADVTAGAPGGGGRHRQRPA